MKKKLLLAATLVAVAAFGLTACGSNGTGAEEAPVEQQAEEAQQQEAAPVEEGALNNAEDGMAIYGQLPNTFSFSSGAGAWSTDITLNPDGTFAGVYHDSDMGDAGNGYPNGVEYLCEFEGRFGAAVKIDDYTYRAKMEELNVLSATGTEAIKDGIRYIYSDPYGFDKAGTFEIYLPGKPWNDLDEDCQSWVWLAQQSEDVLDSAVLYNVNGKEAFVGYDYNLEDYEIAQEPAAEPSQVADTPAADEAAGETMVMTDGIYHGGLVGPDAVVAAEIPAIFDVAFDSQGLVVTASLKYGVNREEAFANGQYYSKSTYHFPLAADVTYYASGGENEPRVLTQAEFLEICHCYNGLGLVVEVSGGQVVSATISS